MIRRKEKLNPLPEKNKEQRDQREESKQIIEGEIKDTTNVEKSLPQRVYLDMVDQYLKNVGGKGKWYWHLRPKFIKDKKKKKEWKRERNNWPRG